MKRLFCLAAIAAALMGHSFTAQAAGVEFGVGETSDSTMTYRLGMQFDWDKSWWQSDVGRLTGYWNGAYTYWNGRKSASNNSLSFSPVFVYEFAGESVKPYVELGWAWRFSTIPGSKTITLAVFSSLKTAWDLVCVLPAGMKSGFGQFTIPTRG